MTAISKDELAMSPLRQAIEITLVAGVVYNVLLICFEENERAKITPIAIDAFNEPSTQFSLNKWEVMALQDKIRRAEQFRLKSKGKRTVKKNIVQHLFHNKSRLTSITFLHYFINTMHENYVDIYDGTKLMEVINFIFDYVNKWQEMGVTQDDMDAAHKEALVIYEKLMKHFKNMGCFL